MTTNKLPEEKVRLEQEVRILRQIAFASGLFQGDVTVRTLLESLAEGVVIIDDSGTVLLVNSRAEQLFGYRREEIVGKPHSLLIPERFREIHEEHQANFFEEPRVRPMGELLDLAGRRKDGSEFPVEISLSFIETINGTLVMAFVSDISLRKKYESHLRESEELFRIHVECVKDYAIFMLDEQGNVLNWNAGAERLKGYHDEEIIGRHFSCFYPEEKRKAGKPEKDLETAHKKGRIEEEGWRVRKDGSLFWADVIITALRDESGSLRGFSNVTRDITERRQSEKALRFSEARYRALYRDNPTMIAVLNADLTMLSVNPSCAGQLGYAIDELEGQPMLKIFHEDDRQAVGEQLRMCLQNPYHMYRWQFRKLRKDGELLWVEEIGQAVYDLNGVINILVVCQDVTERKRAEEEIERLNADLAARAADLEAANRELEAFNYTVAHDLRKPLTIINMLCQTVEDHCGDDLDEQCRGYLQEGYKNTLHMSQLIDALLNFSLLAHVEPRREKVDISMLAQAAAAELIQTEPERRVTFRIADGRINEGDVNLLRVVLDNLLGNAWKHTVIREEAVIEFGSAEIDGKPAYFVRDNGTGFDMADADKLFIPFQRLPGAEEFKGFGIGLATVERIVHRHGGRVWAKGEPGKGATFYFTLGVHRVS
jgi:PAS domain S-box-containing protein